MRHIKIIFLLGIISAATNASAQRPAGQNYRQTDCVTFFGSPLKPLSFLDEITVVYTVTENALTIFPGDTQRISYDTLTYKLSGDSIIFFSRLDTAFLAKQTVRISQPKTFANSGIFIEQSQHQQENNRLRNSDDSIVLHVNISPLLFSAADDFSLHIWRDKKEIYASQLEEYHTTIQVNGNHFQTMDEQARLVYELRYTICKQQQFVLYRDTMTAYNYDHSLNIDFSPPISPFPFRTLYPDADSNRLYARRPGNEQDLPCNYFEPLPPR